MVETFAALAEPHRFQIVELLRTGALPVGDICDRLALPQPKVSKHLRVLKDAGVVAVEARAQQRLYQIEAARFRQLHEWLGNYRALWEERFAGIDGVLEELKRQQRKKGKKK